MKLSIRCTLNTADGAEIVSTINQYPLWRLITGQAEQFTFEAWVNSIADKDALWNDLKPFVDTYTGSIDWHECTHDEASPRPCVIVGIYQR